MPNIPEHLHKRTIQVLQYYLDNFHIHHPAHESLVQTLRNIGNRENIGTRIVNLINDNKSSIRKVSEATNIPVSTLGNWMNNTVPSDFDAVERLANHFNVSFSYILTGKE